MDTSDTYSNPDIDLTSDDEENGEEEREIFGERLPLDHPERELLRLEPEEDVNYDMD